MNKEQRNIHRIQLIKEIELNNSKDLFKIDKDILKELLFLI